MNGRAFRKSHDRHRGRAFRSDQPSESSIHESTQPPSAIFAFASNLAGRHGKGAALRARQNYGAVYGIGVGRAGNAYAIPTKDKNLNTLRPPSPVCPCSG